MEPIEATLLRVTVDWSDYRIDTFNLVIRLSKVQQTAFRLCTILRSPGVPVVPCEPLDSVSSCLKPFRTIRNSLCSAGWIFSESNKSRRHQACLFPAGVVTLVSGGVELRVEHIVHLIRSNLNSCLCTCGLTWPRSRLGVTHDSLGMNGAPFNSCCFFNSPTSPPFPIDQVRLFFLSIT